MTKVTGTLSQQVELDLPDEMLIDQVARDRVAELATQIADLHPYDDAEISARVVELERDAVDLAARVTELEGKDLHAAIAVIEGRLAALEALDLEGELADHAARLLALESRPSGGGGTDALGENAIYVDAMPGADDGAKIDAAWELSRVTGRPIRFSARTYTDRAGASRKKHSSLILRGPNDGWQNPEQAAAGGRAACTVVCNSGTGNSSWIVGDRTTYNFQVDGIYFRSSNGNTQWMHHPFGSGWTCYASEYSNIGFYGFKHALGKPNDACSITLSSWSGQWTNVAVLGTQYSLRGSDCFLEAHINYGWAGANAGQYLMRFENMSKTAVKNLYLTARGGSRAVLVQGPGSNQGGLDIEQCVIEGQNLNDPAMGALIVVEGGGVSFDKIKLNFGMARPSDFTDRADTALVMVLGGTAVFDKLWVNRANGIEAPVVHVTGGRADVQRVYGMQSWAALPKVRVTGGALVQSDKTVSVVTS